jgi:hypothetical protein
MADGVDIDMAHVDMLAVALTKAGPAMVIAADKIIDAEAEAVRSDASSRAPVLTGAQAAGYYVEDAGTGKRISNDTREAFYNEFGTSDTAPQPALLPAADAAERRLVAKFEVALGEVTL